MAEPKSDETLMLEYQKGSYQSFELLYTRHKQPLFRFMLGICQNRAIVEELFQEVWMKLIDAKDRYQVQAKFSTYLYQIARNRVIDHYRKLSTQSEQNLIEMDNLIEEQSQFNFDQPEQLVEADQTRSLIAQCIDNLPYEQKEVFLLRENAELSINEIAELIYEKPENCKKPFTLCFKENSRGVKE